MNLDDVVTGHEALKMEARHRALLKRVPYPERLEGWMDLEHHRRGVEANPDNLWAYYDYFKTLDRLYPDRDFGWCLEQLVGDAGAKVNPSAAWDGYVEMRLARYGGVL